MQLSGALPAPQVQGHAQLTDAWPVCLLQMQCQTKPSTHTMQRGLVLT